MVSEFCVFVKEAGRALTALLCPENHTDQHSLPAVTSSPSLPSCSCEMCLQLQLEGALSQEIYPTREHKSGKISSEMNL